MRSYDRGVSESQLYFRQLLGGVDFAASDPLARQMLNFSYLLGDTASGEALVVDPAYGVGDLLDAAESDAMSVVGALVTHHHADHVGGSLFGHDIEGLAELLARQSMPVHAHRAEVAMVEAATGLSASDVVAHDSGDRVSVGEVEVELLHTPGHTPGSQCFLLDSRLVSGDTLFLDGCGRTDLPGSDPEAMYDSLAKLASLPADVVVYPGHRYSVPPSASMAQVRSTNAVFKPPTRQAWLAMFARG